MRNLILASFALAAFGCGATQKPDARFSSRATNYQLQPPVRMEAGQPAASPPMEAGLYGGAVHR